MSSGELRQTPPGGLAFFAKSQLLTGEEVERALKRMAHEIVERNHGLPRLSVIGLQTGGVAFATRIAELLHDIVGDDVSLSLLDVSFLSLIHI